MNETDIQAIMIDNKTINQRIENSLNVIFADIDITAAQGRVLMLLSATQNAKSGKPRNKPK